jgi:uncharacterized membrane protein (UPF0127 family)
LVLYVFKLQNSRSFHLKNTHHPCSMVYLYKKAVDELLALY